LAHQTLMCQKISLTVLHQILEPFICLPHG